MICDIMDNKIPTVEIGCDIHLLDEQKCNNCNERFKCWTRRKRLLLNVEHITVTQSCEYHDKCMFKIEVVVPDCIKPNANLVGTEIRFFTEVERMSAVGKIKEQDFYLKVNQSARMILKGVCFTGVSYEIT